MTLDCHIAVARLHDVEFIYHCKVTRLWDKRTWFHKSVNMWQHFSNLFFRHSNMSNHSSCNRWSELEHIQVCKADGWNLDIQSLKTWLHHKWYVLWCHRKNTRKYEIVLLYLNCEIKHVCSTEDQSRNQDNIFPEFSQNRSMVLRT